MVTIRQSSVVLPAGKIEPTSLTDSFHRVNSLLPEDQVVVTISPDTTVTEAIQLMCDHDFSQLPVVEGNEVLGVFSFRSFAVQMLGMEEAIGLSFKNLTVDEFIERLDFVHINDDPLSIFASLDNQDAVLVGQPNRLQGIATAMDELRYLYRVARPFVLLAEIELSLRKLIEVCVDNDELEVCVENSLAHQYEEEEIPSRLEEMAFNDYIQIVGDGRNWARFERIFGGGGDWQRKRTRAKLEQARDLRNIVLHFRRELTEQELDSLISHREWLFMRARMFEVRRKAGDSDGTS